MLAQAAARQVYDELVKVEMTAYLRGCQAAFDVIVSADVLVVLRLTRGCRRGGGQCPSCRRAVHFHRGGSLADAAAGAEFVLSPHGRYSHTRRYLERVLTSAGLRSEIVAAELRLEAGSPVPGLVVRATKPDE